MNNVEALTACLNSKQVFILQRSDEAMWRLKDVKQAEREGTFDFLWSSLIIKRPKRWNVCKNDTLIDTFEYTVIPEKMYNLRLLK